MFPRGNIAGQIVLVGLYELSLTFWRFVRYGIVLFSCEVALGTYGILLILSLPSIAWGQEFDETDLRALTMIREADLGVERVYLNEYEYYYVPPADLVTPEYEWRGPMLWRYDGQAIFTDEPDESDEPLLMIEPDYVLTGLEFDADAYLGVGYADKHDRYGRRWVLDYVDVDAAREALNANEAAADALHGIPEPGVEDNPGIAYNPDAGAESWAVLRSWSTINCGGQTGSFFDHSSDSFTQASSLNVRSKKIVIIWGDTENCTGVLVDSNSVLTNAHCTTSASGIEHSANTMVVCSMENLEENTGGGDQAGCFNVADVDTNPNWVDDSPYDVTQDYALLNLASSPGMGWMELSSASDTDINGPVDYLRGYPGYTRSCLDNKIHQDLLTTVDTFNGVPMFGRQLYEADGDVQSTPTGYVKYDTSDGAGASGGPHYYCPNSDGCATHYITGVHAFASICASPPCASGYTAGPKARDIESWVDLNAL